VDKSGKTRAWNKASSLTSAFSAFILCALPFLTGSPDCRAKSDGPAVQPDLPSTLGWSDGPEHPDPQGMRVNGAAVIKLDIINEVVNKTGITKTKAELAVETVFESMKKALSKGDRIELRGFGVFNVRPRKTGIGRNPRTGAEVNIPPGKAVRFKPGKELQSID
jgi:DNA-binding protein HU-beta